MEASIITALDQRICVHNCLIIHKLLFPKSWGVDRGSKVVIIDACLVNVASGCGSLRPMLWQL